MFKYRALLFRGIMIGALGLVAAARDGNASSGKETLLHLGYQIECDEKDPEYGVIRGEVHLPERRIRFDLYRKNKSLYLSIGKNTYNDVKITFNPSARCSLREWKVEAIKVEDLPPGLSPNKSRLWAERYSPVIVPRRNQMNNRDTDVPLTMTYSALPLSNGHSLFQYTVIFSGEDSKRSVRSNLAQMTAYGRQTDIEYVYQVELNSDGEKVREWYQGGVLRTPVGHAKHRFKGKYLKGTDHPILYNSTQNNIFRDRPCASTGDPSVTHSFGNLEAVPFPLAREASMWGNLWMFDASDLELKMEGKLRYATSEFLFIKVVGEKISGNFTPRLILSEGTEFKVSSGSFDRLGENLWGRESYTALPLTSDAITSLRTRTGTGDFFFESTSPSADQSKILDLQFFMIDTSREASEVIDLTSQFSCSSGVQDRNNAPYYGIRCRLNSLSKD